MMDSRKTPTTELQHHHSTGREGVQLPREIVLWIQSLQLSRPLKNPKRDMLNGFLVAELCSRYWRTVSMHSFVNTDSLKTKKSNWFLLQKAFKKNETPLEDAVVQKIMDGRDGAAEALLLRLYTTFTGKHVRRAVPLAPLPTQDALPFDPASTVTTTAAAPKPNAALGDRRHPPPPAQSKPRAAATPSGDDDAAVAAARRAFLRQDSANASAAAWGSRDENGAVAAPRLAPRRLEPSPSIPFPAPSPVGDRADVDLRVSLRTAERPTTIVQLAADDSRAVGASGTTLLLWAEAHVQQVLQAADGEDALQEVPPPYTSYVAFFAEREATLPEPVQQAVWNALLSNSGEAVEIAATDSQGIQPLVALLLFRRHGGELVAPPALHRRAIALFSAILSQLSDSGAHTAINMLRHDVLASGEVRAVLRRLPYTQVELFSALLHAVVLPFAHTAESGSLLAELLSHVYEAVVVAAPDNLVDPRCSYLMLLRALVARLLRPGTRGVSALREDAAQLRASLFSIATYNVTGALAHEAAKVRLAGAALAVTQLQAGSPLLLSIDATLPFLFPLSAPSGLREDPYYAVMQAAWLRAGLERIQKLMGDETNDEDGGEESSARSDDGSEDVPRDVLEAAQQTLGDLLLGLGVALSRAGGDARVKSVLARELASAAALLPDPAASSLAEVLMRYLSDSASAPLVVLFLGTATDNGAVWTHPLLGTLDVSGFFHHTSPLHLAAAVLDVYPVVASETGPQRAAAVAQDLQLAPAVAHRVQWLFQLTVGARGGEPLPSRTVSLNVAQTRETWWALLAQYAPDIALVTAAAAMLHSQSAARAARDDAAVLLELAGMAQHVVWRVYVDWADASARSPSSEETQQMMSKAMKWFQAEFLEKTTM